MKDLFSVGEAARLANTTSETLRHYDRIGLAKPSEKNEWTNYRYYTKEDIVRLNTILALRQMDLPLQRIKEVLEYDDLGKIIDFLGEAERNADEKIAALKRSKAKIQAARKDYESQLHGRPETTGYKICEYTERTILMSDTLTTPALDNLWDYLKHFYDNIPETLREQFEFENLAGVYTNGGYSRMFAVCKRFAAVDGLKILPAGRYLRADCTEEERTETTEKLMRIAENEYNVVPQFSVAQIVISGILKWNYRVQVFIDGAE
jgi:MerR family transcriptional activator of bmr gene